MAKRDALSLALLWVLTATVFWQGIGGQFIWDDFPLIVDNATLQDPSRFVELLTSSFWNVSSSKTGLNETYTHVYRPLVTFALFMQQQLFGLDPRGFHLVSLGLHLLIVTLVFRSLRRTSGEGTGAWLGALAGAALFAVHPSRAQSVAWVSGSTELWMGLFVLVGYGFWLSRPRSVAAASIFFGLALFAKETAVVVPLLLLVDMFGRQGAIDWKRWGRAVGLFSIFVVARLVLMPLPAGASVELSEMPTRLLGSMGHYIQATLWPWQPPVARGFRYTDCSGALVVPIHTLWIGGLAVAALALLGVKWRALRTRPWLVGIAWFVLFLVPVLNIVDLRAHGLAADRFLYVPLFGVSTLLALGLSRVWDTGSSSRMPLMAALALLLAACGVSTRRHVAHFHDSATLWHYEVEHNPTNLYALELVGLQESARDPAQAISRFGLGYQLATQTCNRALGARFALLATRTLIGSVADTDQERLLTLRTFYDRAVETGRLELTLPNMTLDLTLPPGFSSEIQKDAALVGIPHATVTMRTLELARAAEIVDRVLAADPDSDGAWLLAARIQARRGDFAQAERSIEQAEQRAPHNPAVARWNRTLSQAREIASAPANDERARVLRDAQVSVLLQAPEAARRILQPELDRHPGDPALVLAYVRTMTADRRFDLAAAAVDRAEAFAPEEADKWMRLREALRAGQAAQP